MKNFKTIADGEIFTAEFWYRVDGRDLRRIAKLMQKIFIEGNDELFAVRLKFFDEHFRAR